MMRPYAVANASTPVLFQIRRVKAKRTHPWDEMFWEFRRAMARDDLGQNFLLHKTPRPIARSAFFVREKFFDAVVIQRSCRHVVSPGNARQFSGRATRTQCCWAKRTPN
jgi:hypothetical protein